MIRVKFVQGTVADGRCVDVGEVLDLPDEDARLLIGLGRCVSVIGPIVDGDPPDVQAGAPIPGHRDPAPTRRRSR